MVPTNLVLIVIICYTAWHDDQQFSMFKKITNLHCTKDEVLENSNMFIFTKENFNGKHIFLSRVGQEHVSRSLCQVPYAQKTWLNQRDSMS